MAMEVHRFVTRQRPIESLLEGELLAHGTAPLASCKKPQRVVYVQEVAKTAAGKFNRRVMRERLKQAQ